ncbi:MAG: hypothetical protein HC866_10415 [Leptolyngbyaceae cyanobacterium RU_5_1]|nr:hypothetical protein [Leptolyngbyaceae cyanobacterium RU_5_1]
MSDQEPTTTEQANLKPTVNVQQAFAEVPAEQVPRKPTTLAERQEETRGALATSLIGILKWVVGFLLLLIVVDRIAASTFAFHGKKYEYDSTGSKDIATLVLTSLSGLVGTALGFYFGSRGSGIDVNKDD